MNSKNIKPKPFLKWAGGKTQLINIIEKSLPHELITQKNFIYVEPFVGSGAVLFWMMNTFQNIKSAVINDVNADLINVYSTIKHKPDELINVLMNLQEAYYKLHSEEKRKKYFLKKREDFNSKSFNNTDNASLFIFLNKTCFNGLYRVNSHNKFNVPFGKYASPKICDAPTILACSNFLQRVIILNEDYSKILRYASANTFFYLDPPYKPISKTASFNSYSKDNFNDEEQRKLKAFCDKLSAKKSKWLLSNSDVKNIDSENNFFDELYSGNSVFIERIKARRAINSNASKRGAVSELLISNYKK